MSSPLDGTDVPKVRSLADAKKIGNPAIRVRALNDMLARLEQVAEDAREYRADVIADLADEYKPAMAARLTGLSPTTIKAARKASVARKAAK